MSSHAAVNPALVEWTGHRGLPRFDAVKDTDFAPAFNAAFVFHEAEIDAIAGDSDAPTFANTVTALELAGDVRRRLWQLATEAELFDRSRAAVGAGDRQHQRVPVEPWSAIA